MPLYCNVAAIEKGLDPVGSASAFKAVAVIETPLPWKKDIYTIAGALPQNVLDLFTLWMKRYRDGLPYDRHVLMVAPDPEYSRPGFRRVIFYNRSSPMIAEFDRIEYLVPDADLGALVWALHEAPETLHRFAAYRQPDAPIRDVLVCTHGTVDAACAKFGFPLYNRLRKQHASDLLRVWRVSHFGGHVYAPTLVELPVGHYWAYVDDEHADAIARREGDVRRLYGHYRGWAGFGDSFLQALERELWMEHGFAWFGFCKSGRVLNLDAGDDPQWADVELAFASADGRISGIVQARVEVRERISLIHSTNNDQTYAYPQYAVVEMRVAAHV